MITAYETTKAYDVEATYWGLEGTDGVLPTVVVEIDTSSDSFVLVEGDGDYGGAINYDTTSTYNTTTVVNYDGLVKFRDITNSVRTIDIRRGRGPLAFNQFEAGTLALELVDTTSEFLPSNISSRHYPRLTPMRPIRVRANWSGVKFDLFRGYVDSIDINWQPGVQAANVTIQATDLFKVLSNIDTTVAGTAGDSSEVRVGAILDSFSFPATMRSVDTGIATLQAGDGSRVAALDALRSVETAEAGAIFIDTAGRLTFKNRTNTFPSAPVSYNFADDGTVGAVNYSEIDVAYDDELLYNRVAVTRTGGIEQVATDSTSVNTYQRRTIELTGVLLNDDTQAATLASFLLGKRKNPGMRVENITLNAYRALVNLSAALGIDLLQVVSVTRTATGSTFTANLVVNGLEHRITPDSWQTTIVTQNIP